METLIIEIAQRIKGLRQLMEISVEEMAGIVGMTPEEYEEYETGANDFPFTFLMKCAQRFGIDIVELMTGENPHLTFYSIVRNGEGLPMERRKGFGYRHLAWRIKNKLAEPFLVTAPYSEEDEKAPARYSVHEGQEFDYILSGSLKIDLDGHVEVLHAGDCILYDSGHRHSMTATGGADCDFLAVVLKKPVTEEK